MWTQKQTSSTFFIRLFSPEGDPSWQLNVEVMKFDLNHMGAQDYLKPQLTE